ncbi:hypothetical protein EMPS_10427 [Entomortierella parvispora]|uniref:Uncharacterized protein n=1 Tax=Entomortierella parvispora TaxID=205924 RepID=A0A9P3M196_9FUNG|nr:hypothetical protein EMPS_10427 [Entomortierella parvispora]
MDYSTIIETFVISEMNAKAKLEAKSEQSRATTSNPSISSSSLSSTFTSTSSPEVSKARLMNNQRALLRARLELEAIGQPAEINGVQASSTRDSLSSLKPFSHTPQNQGQRPSSSLASTQRTNNRAPGTATARTLVLRNNKEDQDIPEMTYVEDHLAGIKIKKVNALRRQTRSDLLDVVHQQNTVVRGGDLGDHQNNHGRNSVGSLQDVGVEDLFQKRKSLRNSVVSGSGHGSGYPGRGYGWGRQHRRGSNDSLEVPCNSNRRFSKMK